MIIYISPLATRNYFKYHKNKCVFALLKKKILILTLADAGLIFRVRLTTSPSAEIMETISPLLSKVSALI